MSRDSGKMFETEDIKRIDQESGFIRFAEGFTLPKELSRYAPNGAYHK
jgi:hypothetical protein